MVTRKAKPISKAEWDELVRKAKEFLLTPEGQAGLKAAFKRGAAEAKRLSEEVRLKGPLNEIVFTI